MVLCFAGVSKGTKSVYLFFFCSQGYWIFLPVNAKKKNVSIRGLTDMKTKGIQASVVFISPAGSTRKIALYIQEKLQSAGVKAVCLDLAADTDVNQISDADLLFIGSPVYAYHPVPQVMSFLSEIPVRSFYAVLFVTWGGVTSGTALFDMAAAVQNRGAVVAGAAKVFAPHSLMQQLDKPLGQGHPDASDLAMIDKLLDITLAKIKSGNETPVDINSLLYQPEDQLETIRKTTLEKAKSLLPPLRTVIPRCNKCGICIEKCPVHAITLRPSLTIGGTCISCYSCVYACPEKAITADLSRMGDWLNHKAEECGEKEKTEIFY